MKGFVLNPTYRVVDGVPEIHIYGVLEDGDPCLLIDDRCQPYFFVCESDVSRVRALTKHLTFGQGGVRTFDGASAVAVSAAVPGDVPPIRSRLERAGIRCFEADIRFAYRYLIDHRIRGAFEVHGHADHHARLGKIIRNPELRPAHWKPRLKTLSIDIETDPRARRVFAIALHTHDFERVLIVHDHLLDKGEPVSSERALIRRFIEYVNEINPDIITGWNVVDFDLAVLSRVARNHGIRLTIGRGSEEFQLRKDASFTRESRAVIFGRQVLDGLALMRSAFYKLDDYKLETAAQAILGKGKLIAGEGRASEIEETYHHDPQRLVDYNLQDARLVTEILDETGLVDLAVERSLLTGMQLDRVGAAIASIDSLYLPELRRRHIVAPSVHQRPHEAIGGGYVMDSKPGLYENVFVFDFKSLYPSIIRTFNIDPVTCAPEDSHQNNLLTAPNGSRFQREPDGILPTLLERLAEEREAAKRENHPVKANAIKILMNSFYGVLGSTSSRLFSPSSANAITSFGQQFIQWSADLAREAGYDVIYGDTDSLFVHAPEVDESLAPTVTNELRKMISDEIAKRIGDRYRRESHLDLEFEKHYLRFFLPEVRGGKVGSKKRYAGLLRDGADGERIEYVGLEAVRRDSSEVAKRFQRGLLDRVFHEQPLEEFIEQFVEKLREGNFDDELVYRKALRKDLNAYTKTTPPHVKAARKLKGAVGRIVAYVMTIDGPEPVEALEAAPNYEHYIDHQLAPVADAVLHLQGKSFEAIIPRTGQMALF